ncbi:chromatin accessibility complex protein 1-like [Watersipora subatra]|uniref:chromatin accessibility complex protein 1-like n=1 Tax=Watersipora subatra TaxID=2589382 RepID=UPI00355C4E86
MAEGEEEDVIKENKEFLLPISRIRIIMKSSPDVENVSQDALSAVSGATELFVKDLVQRVYASTEDGHSCLEYDDLATLVNSLDVYGFLDEIVPQKVLGREILGLSKEGDEQENGEASENEEGMKSEDEEGNSEEEEEKSEEEEDQE